MSGYVSAYRKVGAPWGEARLAPIQMLLSQFTTVVDWCIARSLGIRRNGHILGPSSGPHMIERVDANDAVRARYAFWI
jgi:hypothetical protein